ncbi:MAG: tRNA (adenosine(37)-N6)-threonylcarbamoyltransferase complex transferase subunit TsaD [Opitutae bacterium]|jgi:N6-L-threonylcarbamoyladenine synthase|nr:tRNA (adenosine(37)-N6)-threonylcarbamoyltransferase complex transferase subunit TsaD [Opitutae bacterium]
MILGIESSCDESALALYDSGNGLVDEWVHSQIVKHSEYGGVVPDIAVLEHLNNFPPLLDLARKKYRLEEKVSKIAVTCGPGLVGCLGIGISVAKSLGILWEVPVVGVNHLRGHAFSPFISLGEVSKWKNLLPHLGLLVSGGNTLLFSINEELGISILARTVDDAAGEALDKGAKLLGIPYPGGAELERRSIGGDPKAYDFPQAFPQKSDMKFSFSGLKTSLLYTIQKMNEAEVNDHFSDLSASYQWAAVKQLIRKTSHAWNQAEFKSLGLSGGVANNKVLRSEMKGLADRLDTLLLCAEPKYTGDNASMIAYASYIDPENTWTNEMQGLSFNASLKLEDVSP